jgi:hypothetical protein
MRRVRFQWTATKEMIADGLTKALPKQRFQSFVNMIGMVDIKEQLNKEKQLEDLRENIRARRKDSDEIIV